MKKTSTTPFLPEGMKAKYVQAIVDYFSADRGMEIGVIAAEEILEFFAQQIGKEIYTQAVQDCKQVIESRIEDVKLEIDILMPQ